MRVLVVEDEPRLAKAVVVGLADLGFSVDVAHDGEEGLRMARHGDYDAVVLGIMLPKLNGYSPSLLTAPSGELVPGSALGHDFVAKSLDRVESHVTCGGPSMPTALYCE